MRKTIHSHLATASPQRPALSQRERVPKLVLVLAAWVFLTRSFASAATNVVTEPFEGVRLVHSKSMAPRQVDMWVAEIDMKAPGISFLVTPSNGELPGDTSPQTVRAFVTQVGAQI